MKSINFLGLFIFAFILIQLSSCQKKDVIDNYQTFLNDLGIEKYNGNKNVFDIGVREVTIDKVTNNKISLKDYVGKKVVLVNFWFLTCPFCLKEKREFEKLKKKLAGKDLEILSVSVDKEAQADQIPIYIERNKMTTKVLFDPQRKLANALGQGSVPTTYIINKQGVIIGVAHRDRKWGSDEYVEFLQKVIGDSKNL